MVTMRFHWYNEETEQEGTFTVNSTSLEQCCDIANEEVVQTETLYFTDYYQIN